MLCLPTLLRAHTRWTDIHGAVSPIEMGGNEMIERLETILKRPLTTQETRYVNWLQGWDRETKDTFNGLFEALYEAGKNESK